MSNHREKPPRVTDHLVVPAIAGAILGGSCCFPFVYLIPADKTSPWIALVPVVAYFTVALSLRARTEWITLIRSIKKRVREGERFDQVEMNELFAILDCLRDAIFVEERILGVFAFVAPVVAALAQAAGEAKASCLQTILLFLLFTLAGASSGLVWANPTIGRTLAKIDEAIDTG